MRAGNDFTQCRTGRGLAASRRPFGDGYARPQGQRRRKAESPAEARFTNPNQICYNTDNKQESFVSTGLRNECCTGYWMAGGE